MATFAAARPLVGRQGELGVLRGVLDAVRSGRGGLVLVSGEAGVGKTSLVEALAEEAGAVGVAVRWGRAWEGGGVPAYWPWAQVISAMAADAAPGALARRLGPGAGEVAVVAPEVGARVPGLVPASPSAALDATVRLYEAVGAFLAASAAEDGPLVVVLDDLHFADDASLRLLVHLAPALAVSSVVVVGTHRPLEPGSPPRLGRWLAAAARHGTTVALGGLDEAGVACLLASVTGPAPSAGIAHRVHALTEGNPFLVLEAGRLLDVSGRVSASAVLPTEAGVLVRRRLGGLGEPARGVLARAAVLGREADLPMLVAVADQEAMVVLDALGEAQRLGLVVEAGLGRWAFAHALVREALLEDLTGAEEAEVHRRAVAALEAGDGSSGADVAWLARLAHHAAAGADAATAARYCERAGRAALDALAFDDAAEWFRRALDRLAEEGGGDRVGRAELLLALGEARSRAGEFPEARDACRHALALARSTGSPELVARAALGLVPLPESITDRARTEALEEALAVLPTGDSVLRARVLLAVAVTRHVADLDRYRERVLDPADQGVAMARRVGDPGTLRAVLTDWHFVVDHAPGARQACLAVATELVELCAAAGDRERLVVARHWLIADRLALGDVEGAAAELEMAAEEADRLRLPFLQWGGAFLRAGLALLAGRLDEAERLAGDALAIGERSGFADVEGGWVNQLMQIRYHQGRFAELLELTTRQLDHFPYPGDGVELAVALAHLGRLDEAREELARAWPGALSVVPAAGALALVPTADACCLVADVDRAAEVYENLLPFSGQHVIVGVACYSLGSSELYLGRLATLLGRFDEADNHFAAAQRMHERLGARIWAAHTDADHARMLLARGRPGDRPRAADLLARARTEFAAMGMDVFERRAAGQLDKLEARAPGERARLWREDTTWSLAYAGAVVHVQDSKGVRHLAHLLARPNQPVHAVELAGQSVDASDPHAVERARLGVTRSLRTALARIAEVHPALGGHLAATVRVGLRSSYLPDPQAPVSWDVHP